MTPEAEELILRLQSLLDNPNLINPYYTSIDKYKGDIRKKIREIKTGKVA